MPSSSRYTEFIKEITECFPLGEAIIGEEVQKDFIRLYEQF